MSGGLRMKKVNGLRMKGIQSDGEIIMEYEESLWNESNNYYKIWDRVKGTVQFRYWEQAYSKYRVEQGNS